jgi:glycosyltransferase involved in cell wall biosynthesis
LGLDGYVEITGWLPYEKMLAKLNDCDMGVYCNPSTEWFQVAQPLKVCEYLALGKPTIAWDYPGTRRLLNDGRFGTLIPVGNKSGFAAAIIHYVDPIARASVEGRIRSVINGKWSSNYWYERVLDILREAKE